MSIYKLNTYFPISYDCDRPAKLDWPRLESYYWIGLSKVINCSMFKKHFCLNFELFIRIQSSKLITTKPSNPLFSVCAHADLFSVKICSIQKMKILTFFVPRTVWVCQKD
jgi:hypothetical protein